MIIRNTTQNKVLTHEAKIAASFLDRLLGLINPRNPRFLIIKTRFGLHTFFLDEPIDVMLLDDTGSIIRLKADLPPFSFYFYPPQYSLLIEMPHGTIKKNHLQLNDKISIE